MVDGRHTHAHTHSRTHLLSHAQSCIQSTAEASQIPNPALHNLRWGQTGHSVQYNRLDRELATCEGEGDQEVFPTGGDVQLGLRDVVLTNRASRKSCYLGPWAHSWLTAGSAYHVH